MKFSNGSDAVRPAALKDFDSERRGSSVVFTFDFLGWTRVGIQDGSLPGDIEEDFDRHVCGGRRESSVGDV